MIAAGRTLPDGDRPNLAWYAEPAERFTATGPYDLAVAGDAMHWFDLETPVSSPEGLRTAAGTGTVAYSGTDALRRAAGVVRRIDRLMSGDAKRFPAYLVVDNYEIASLSTTR